MRVYTNSVLELSGGNWRLDPFTRVQVWVPDSPVEVECAFDDPELPKVPKKRDSTPAIDARLRRVPCPTCDGTKSHRAKSCQKCAAKARTGLPINHGTSGGHGVHRARGEKPCALCIEADRAYQAAYRAKTKHTNTKDVAA